MVAVEGFSRVVLGVYRQREDRDLGALGAHDGIPEQGASEPLALPLPVHRQPT